MTYLNEKITPGVLVVTLGVLFALIWSLSFIATKAALQDVPPIGLAASRLLLAGFILAAFNLKRTIRFIRAATARDLLRIVLAGLLSQCIYLSASYWSLVYMPTSLVNIVVSALPLLTIPFSFALLGEEIRLSSIVAFTLSIVGVGVTIAAGTNVSVAQLSIYLSAAGVLLASVAALALGNVLVKPLISKASLFPICSLQFVSSGVAALTFSASFQETSVNLDILATTAKYILFLSVVGSILGTAIWFKLLQRLPANTASSFFLLTPVFGILFGQLFFDEPVTGTKLVGVAVITAAILLRVLPALPAVAHMSKASQVTRRSGSDVA